jgi:hypothetical protein
LEQRIYERAVRSAGLEKLPTDQDLRVPHANKSLSVLESANYNFSVNNKFPEPERES